MSPHDGACHALDAAHAAGTLARSWAEALVCMHTMPAPALLITGVRSGLLCGPCATRAADGLPGRMGGALEPTGPASTPTSARPVGLTECNRTSATRRGKDAAAMSASGGVGGGGSPGEPVDQPRRRRYHREGCAETADGVRRVMGV